MSNEVKVKKVVGVWEMAKVAEELPEDYYLAIGEDYEIYVLDEYGQPLSNKEEQ